MIAEIKKSYERLIEHCESLSELSINLIHVNDEMFNQLKKRDFQLIEDLTQKQTELAQKEEEENELFIEELNQLGQFCGIQKEKVRVRDIYPFLTQEQKEHLDKSLNEMIENIHQVTRTATRNQIFLHELSQMYEETLMRVHHVKKRDHSLFYDEEY